MAVHSRMVCSPPGFVRRKIPNLQRSAGYIHVRTTEAHGREVRARAYCGVEVGAQTTANDSGSMRWKPECVWRSTEDMKPTSSI